MDIFYIDRKTGQKLREKVYGQKAIAFLYGNGGRLKKMLAALIRPLLSGLSFFSILYGYVQKTRWSCGKVKKFIEEYGVDETEFATREFVSFNDFFIRKLKKECRPINPDPNFFSMPADGRYLVYPRIESFEVKGRKFDIDSFLQNPALADRYRNGSVAIVRLCPTDYHRFHFPCDCTPTTPRLINGPLGSVNPIALYKNFAILSENKRVLTELNTEKFGAVLYVEIGATAVGSIHQTFTPGKPVKKGDEKGYFEFGGSCLVLLFENGRLQFDADLVQNSHHKLETKANFGETMGSSLS